VVTYLGWEDKKCVRDFGGEISSKQFLEDWQGGRTALR